MMIKALITVIGVISIFAILSGCSGEPTNEPSAADVSKANADRAAAVDNDPKLTPQQKADLKAHMGLGPKGQK